VDLIDALVAYERVHVLQCARRPADAGLVHELLEIARRGFPKDPLRSDAEDPRVANLVDPVG
jgi:hypothetical protein